MSFLACVVDNVELQYGVDPRNGKGDEGWDWWLPMVK